MDMPNVNTQSTTSEALADKYNIDAGHAAFEPGNVHELVTASDAFA